RFPKAEWMRTQLTPMPPHEKHTKKLVYEAGWITGLLVPIGIANQEGNRADMRFWFKLICAKSSSWFLHAKSTGNQPGSVHRRPSDGCGSSAQPSLRLNSAA